MNFRDAPYYAAANAVPEPDDAEGTPSLDAEVNREIRIRGRGHAYRAATRREAVSGHDGRFLLTGLTPGFHRVRGFLDSYRIRVSGGAYGARPGAFLKLVAEKLVEVPVEVEEPDGTRASAAELRLRGREQRWITWSPSHASVQLIAGSYQLRATADGGRLASSTVRIETAKSIAGRPVVLRLVRRIGIEGVVRFPPGRSSAFHDVVALLLEPGADASPKRLSTEGHRATLFGGSGNGVPYSIPDLEPGQYLVGVVFNRRRVLASTRVTVEDGMVSHDFALSEKGRHPVGTLVRVLRPDGEPAPFVEVRASYVTPQGGGPLLRNPERVAPGVYRVFGVKPPAGQAGHFEIQVRSKKYGDRAVTFDPAKDEDVTIHLEDPAYLTVVLPGYVGSRYEGVSHLAVVRRGAPVVNASRFTPPPGPDGRQTFGPLVPGEYEVVLWFRPWESMRGPLLEQPVKLASGRRTVSLELPSLYVVEVRIEGKEENKPIYLQRIGARGSSSPTKTSDGRFFRFTGVRAGQYVLSRFNPTERMPIDVVRDRVVSFRPLLLDALKVSITDPTGILARAGLIDGDLVTAIDGKEITSEDQGRALLRLAVGKGKAVLSILRGGKQKELTVALEGALDPARAGGEIQPWTR